MFSATIDIPVSQLSELFDWLNGFTPMWQNGYGITRQKALDKLIECSTIVDMPFPTTRFVETIVFSDPEHLMLFKLSWEDVTILENNP